jgi:hypothetical protein
MHIGQMRGEQGQVGRRQSSEQAIAFEALRNARHPRAFDDSISIRTFPDH